ncbi:MAG TPA: GNAT family N-acyltransferase [Rugosimonospora sp.]|nr:GNAT family N-acyltransferase [Rugosimonospora sp.]
MTLLAATAPAHPGTRYTLRIAGSDAEIRAAQRLRHQVFAGELGAHLHTPVAGLDADEFDAVCDHLVVVAEDRAEVVGTYRMLPPGRSPRRYADTEFDLSALAPIAGDLVEAGRSCVHPGHRDGTVINLMWAGIARYMHLSGYRWLGGCASVGLADGGVAAAGVWDLARRKHLAPPEYRVRPHRPWPPVDPAGARVRVPPLLRGYLRLGAWVCGAPAYDPDFNCADLYVLLGMDRIDPRYLRHFLGGGSP